MSQIKSITNQIVKKYQPEEIILFGSQAKGASDQYSDYDLIVIKKTKESFMSRLKNFPLLPIRTDVFIYTPGEFQKMKREGSIFLENALKSSQVIYEKSSTRSKKVVPSS